ncbi:MAG: diguanylate cyclase [Candidatus Sedimenticola sp. PURPLELP]
MGPGIPSNQVDSSHAVEIAERVWWVGHAIEGDHFQSHAYLIEQGDQSVLVDPGSPVTIGETMRKIEEVIPFSDIRYFICHHQDPDITASLPEVASRLTRDDAVVVTHGRAEALIKHYGPTMPFWRIEENEWTLQLEDRELHFVFTPYAHFAGAFCTFDATSQVLFSSDLFGGMTEEFELFAEDESYAESMRLFHEHYIPSREVMGFALTRIQEYPVKAIAPQHGSIIQGELVETCVNALKNMDCGLYLLARGSTDIERLSMINATLRDISSTMILSRDFKEIAESMLEIARRILPAVRLEFHAQLDGDQVWHLTPDSHYRGALTDPPPFVSRMFGINRDEWLNQSGGSFNLQDINGKNYPGSHGMLLPLFKPEDDWVFGVAVIYLKKTVAPDQEVERIVEQMSSALQVAVERETLYRSIDLERQVLYERSIRDPLTGLFNRLYMEDTLHRLFEIHDRNDTTPIGLALIDLDHFKRVNDNYGHVQGDHVLVRVADTIRSQARAGDLPVRLGGEEFGLFVIGEPSLGIVGIAERLRQQIGELEYIEPLQELQVTVSVGTAIRQQGESLQQFIDRTDCALYSAKHGGRNQVHVADGLQATFQTELGFE